MGWEKLIVPLCPPPLARLGTSGVPGSFLALPLTPDVTLGQTLNTCSGALFILHSKGEKGLCSSLFRNASWSKEQEKEAREKGVGTTTSKNPHTILHQVHQSSLPQSPTPPSRLCDSSILAQKRRPQHLLNPLRGAELSGRG